MVELVVTVALVAITLGLAVPAFLDMIRNNRVATQANELVTAFIVARSEAVKRGVEIRVTAGANGWGSGWSVRTGDINRDGDVADEGENEVLRQFDALAEGGTLAPFNEGTTTVNFNSEGTTAGNECFNMAFTSEFLRSISVSAAGHVSSAHDACN